MSVDWTQPIEAYHPDGRVVAVTLDPTEGKALLPNFSRWITPSLGGGRYKGFREDGSHYVSLWRIRNRDAVTLSRMSRVEGREWCQANGFFPERVDVLQALGLIEAEPPAKLTITLSGPQGSGKTRWAMLLADLIPVMEKAGFPRPVVVDPGAES